eukprot:gnl/MRDRNA2_/MRDRNA2_83070_c0_seq1.p1 gnl/MRDRNA2_/MRDRNA2_83070_c0~~gnl/MRDRNA2_/MRDRNA2_83070_c0_seq1.p1  ORF type:complete len:2711 (+),score=616.98 gnl/MRDRNA2_/MRDRNA2_83070_c0_seq1:845-8134(+)
MASHAVPFPSHAFPIPPETFPPPNLWPPSLGPLPSITPVVIPQLARSPQPWRGGQAPLDAQLLLEEQEQIQAEQKKLYQEEWESKEKQKKMENQTETSCQTDPHFTSDAAKELAALEQQILKLASERSALPPGSERRGAITSEMGSLEHKLRSLELRVAASTLQVRGDMAVFDRHLVALTNEAASLPAGSENRKAIFEKIGALRERRRISLDTIVDDSGFSALPASPLQAALAEDLHARNNAAQEMHAPPSSSNSSPSNEAMLLTRKHLTSASGNDGPQLGLRSSNEQLVAAARGSDSAHAIGDLASFDNHLMALLAEAASLPASASNDALFEKIGAVRERRRSVLEAMGDAAGRKISFETSHSHAAERETVNESSDIGLLTDHNHRRSLETAEVFRKQKTADQRNRHTVTHVTTESNMASQRKLRHASFPALQGEIASVAEYRTSLPDVAERPALSSELAASIAATKNQQQIGNSVRPSIGSVQDQLRSLEHRLTRGSLASFDNQFASVAQEASLLPAEVPQRCSIFEKLGALQEQRRSLRAEGMGQSTPDSASSGDESQTAQVDSQILQPAADDVLQDARPRRRSTQFALEQLSLEGFGIAEKGNVSISPHFPGAAPEQRGTAIATEPVSVNLTFDMAFSSRPLDFEARVLRGLSAALKEPPQRFAVLGLHSGSVVMQVHILPAAIGSTSELVAQRLEELAASRSAVLLEQDNLFNTLKAVSRQSPTPRLDPEKPGPVAAASRQFAFEQTEFEPRPGLVNEIGDSRVAESEGRHAASASDPNAPKKRPHGTVGTIRHVKQDLHDSPVEKQRHTVDPNRTGAMAEIGELVKATRGPKGDGSGSRTFESTPTFDPNTEIKNQVDFDSQINNAVRRPSEKTRCSTSSSVVILDEEQLLQVTSPSSNSSGRRSETQNDAEDGIEISGIAEGDTATEVQSREQQEAEESRDAASDRGKRSSVRKSVSMQESCDDATVTSADSLRRNTADVKKEVYTNRTRSFLEPRPDAGEAVRADHAAHMKGDTNVSSSSQPSSKMRLPQHASSTTREDDDELRTSGASDGADAFSEAPKRQSEKLRRSIRKRSESGELHELVGSSEAVETRSDGKQISAGSGGDDFQSRAKESPTPQHPESIPGCLSEMQPNTNEDKRSRAPPTRSKTSSELSQEKNSNSTAHEKRLSLPEMQSISEVVQGTSETMPRPLLLRLGRLLREDGSLATDADQKASGITRSQLWEDLTGIDAAGTENEVVVEAMSKQLQNTLGMDPSDISSKEESWAPPVKFATDHPRPSAILPRPPRGAQHAWLTSQAPPPAELWTKDVETEKKQAMGVLQFWSLEAAATRVQRQWRGKKARDRSRAKRNAMQEITPGTTEKYKISSQLFRGLPQKHTESEEQVATTVVMSIENVDFAKLDNTAKFELELSLKKTIAKNTQVGEDEVSVTLQPGSIKVTARIKPQSGMKLDVNTKSLSEDVLDAAKSIDSVRRAAVGGKLIVTEPKVEYEDDKGNDAPKTKGLAKSRPRGGLSRAKTEDLSQTISGQKRSSTVCSASTQHVTSKAGAADQMIPSWSDGGIANAGSSGFMEKMMNMVQHSPQQQQQALQQQHQGASSPVSPMFGMPAQQQQQQLLQLQQELHLQQQKHLQIQPRTDAPYQDQQKWLQQWQQLQQHQQQLMFQQQQQLMSASQRPSLEPEVARSKVVRVNDEAASESEDSDHSSTVLQSSPSEAMHSRRSLAADVSTDGTNFKGLMKASALFKKAAADKRAQQGDKSPRPDDQLLVAHSAAPRKSSVSNSLEISKIIGSLQDSKGQTANDPHNLQEAASKNSLGLQAASSTAKQQSYNAGGLASLLSAKDEGNRILQSVNAAPLKTAAASLSYAAHAPPYGNPQASGTDSMSSVLKDKLMAAEAERQSLDQDRQRLIEMLQAAESREAKRNFTQRIKTVAAQELAERLRKDEAYQLEEKNQAIASQRRLETEVEDYAQRLQMSESEMAEAAEQAKGMNDEQKEELAAKRKKEQQAKQSKRDKAEQKLTKALTATEMNDETARDALSSALEGAVVAEVSVDKLAKARQRGGVAIAAECWDCWNQGEGRLPNIEVIRKLLAGGAEADGEYARASGLYWLVKAASAAGKGGGAAKAKAAPKAKAKGVAGPSTDEPFCQAMALLIEHKADVERGDAFGSPLWWALHHHKPKIAELLISSGAECDKDRWDDATLQIDENDYTKLLEKHLPCSPNRQVLLRDAKTKALAEKKKGVADQLEVLLDDKDEPQDEPSPAPSMGSPLSGLWNTALTGAAKMASTGASSSPTRGKSLWGALGKSLPKATTGMQSPVSSGIQSLLSSPSPTLPNRTGTSDLLALIRKAQAQKNDVFADPAQHSQDSGPNSGAAPSAKSLAANSKIAEMLMGSRGGGFPLRAAAAGGGATAGGDPGAGDPSAPSQVP